MNVTFSTRLKTIITRTYTVGLCFEGADRKERRQNELRANKIIRGLQDQISEKINPEKMDETLELVGREGSLSGTRGATTIAKHFGDRSNLGQVAYVTMLAAANGTLDRERKIQTFIEFLQGEPAAAV